MYGSQFSVIRQIHPSDVADLHTAAIDYVTKKLSSAAKAEKSGKTKAAKERQQAKLAQTLTFFKPLFNLLAPVKPHDAARLQKHLEDRIEGSGIRAGTSKIWEGYKHYEKRLLNTAGRAMGRDGDERSAEHEGEAVNETRGQTTPTTSPAKRRVGRSEADGTPTKGSARKRKHVDEEDVADVIDVAPIADDPSFALDLEDDADGAGAVDNSLVLDVADGGEEMDLDLELELPSTADQPTPLSRTASLEPGVKRRKTTRKV